MKFKDTLLGMLIEFMADAISDEWENFKERNRRRNERKARRKIERKICGMYDELIHDIYQMVIAEVGEGEVWIAKANERVIFLFKKIIISDLNLLEQHIRFSGKQFNSNMPSNSEPFTKSSSKTDKTSVEDNEPVKDPPSEKQFSYEDFMNDVYEQLRDLEQRLNRVDYDNVYSWRQYMDAKKIVLMYSFMDRRSTLELFLPTIDNNDLKEIDRIIAIAHFIVEEMKLRHVPSTDLPKGVTAKSS